MLTPGFAWRRTRTVQRTIQLQTEVGSEVLRRGCWLDRRTGEAEVLDVAHAEALEGWLDRMAECGTTGWIERCPDGHFEAAVTPCCQVPACPRLQRRRSARYVTRALNLAARYRDGQRHELKSGQRSTECTWKLVTLTFRPSSTPEEAVERALETRAAFFRWTKDRGRKRPRGRVTGYVLGGTGAVEFAGKLHAEHVHLHLAVYGEWIKRAELVRWLRKRTCTVKGCAHPADDRCEPCRKARRACNCASHLKRVYGDKPRCNGSYVVDVRRMRAKVGERRQGRYVHRERSTLDGLREALKYATKPMHVAPRADGSETLETLAHVELTLRASLALTKRHRVQSYGLMRQKTPDEDRADEDREPDERPPQDGHRCPGCNQPMRAAAGWRWDPRRRRMVPIDPHRARARVRGPDDRTPESFKRAGHALAHERRAASRAGSKRARKKARREHGVMRELETLRRMGAL